MPLTHDKVLLLDFRQNYAEKAVNQIGQKVQNVKTVLSFKKKGLDFFQLTEQNLGQSGAFNDITHLSKIIIRGHCCKGSSFITSDYYDGLKKSLSPQLAPLKQVNSKLKSEQEILKSLELEIVDLRKKISMLQSYQSKSPTINGGIDPASPSGNSSTIDGLIDQHNIIFNAYISVKKNISDINTNEKPNAVEIARLANESINKELLTVSQLAKFLANNLNPIKITPSEAGFSGPSQSRRKLLRRLTIQAAMCEAAAPGLDPGTQPSFLSQLYSELSHLGIEANIVGYLTSTSFLKDAEADQTTHFDLMGVENTIKDSNRLHSRGMGYKKPAPSTGNALASTQHPKMIFNKEYPNGTSYISWKGSNFTAADGPMADLLMEITAEIWKDDWNNRGKWILGRKVPAGIVALRNILPQNWIPDKLDDNQIKKLWWQVRATIQERVNSGSYFRATETSDYYASILDVMKYY